MKYVLGIDLGTSSVKVSVVDKMGRMAAQRSESYDLLQKQIGYSEQNPEDWVRATTKAIRNIIDLDRINATEIESLSYSGQMHGLVLLDDNYRVLRPAILWNDTRTVEQSRQILKKMGKGFLKITHNLPLEGFTLPKLLWIQDNEPEIFKKIKVFLLPKDYLRYRMTGHIATDYSDAAGTVMLDAKKNTWSREICQPFAIPLEICPPLGNSDAYAGNITKQYASISQLSTHIKVYVGAADNAAGALGAGIVREETALCSIGTSGVVLKYADKSSSSLNGKLHVFNHAIPGKYYMMGVTLSAGYSLSWLKKILDNKTTFGKFILEARHSTIGANGLLFSPYLVGERTPYDDGNVRGSFIGLDSNHKQADLVRSVMEGIVFSFKDLLNIYKVNHSEVKSIISIGGGAKSDLWLQIQADIFDIPVICLTNEQGPGLGAAMIAAVGTGWFQNFQDCGKEFVERGKIYLPEPKNVQKYCELYRIYRQIYKATADISHQLVDFRKKNF
ncbi:xylulokinase [Pediococcus siamensis]|uniref:xylulokinase n=1 Tax=Pediococcus siamensis TaxID=381829 RepID=UPI0039A0B088